jgi:hypothetical protein
MRPECRKCVVREAPQRCPLPDNGSLGTFPQQQVGLLKPSIATKLKHVSMEMWIQGDRHYMQRVFRVNGQATNVLLVYRRLFKRSCRAEHIHCSSFVLSDS